MELAEAETKRKGIKIRLGKLDKKYKRAKRQGETKLQMEIQSKREDLERELAEVEAFEKNQPKEPGPVTVPAARVGLSPEETRLAVNMIVGVENTVLSAVAGRSFKLEIKEEEQRSMEEALSLSASKRLTVDKKAKLDLAFLAMAFLAPMLAALPKALAAKKMKTAEPAAATEEETGTSAATVSTLSLPMESLVGPMPPKAQ